MQITEKTKSLNLISATNQIEYLTYSISKYTFCSFSAHKYVTMSECTLSNYPFKQDLSWYCCYYNSSEALSRDWMWSPSTKVMHAIPIILQARYSVFRPLGMNVFVILSNSTCNENLFYFKKVLHSGRDMGILHCCPLSERTFPLLTLQHASSLSMLHFVFFKQV